MTNSNSNNNNGDRLDRIERSIEILTQVVSETRADIAVQGARIDAMIHVIAESTIRTEARISTIEAKIEAIEAKTNAIEQLVRQNEQRITRLEEK